METGEYGLTRGTCFVVCRLEVVAVAGLLWIFLCVFFRFFVSVNAHGLPAPSMRPACLIYLSINGTHPPCFERRSGLREVKQAQH